MHKEYINMKELICHIAPYYLLIINLTTLLTYSVDKWKAKHNKWRISEALLLILAVLGGSISAWLAMKICHHKTRHRKFKYGIPIIVIGQTLLLLYLYITSIKA